MIHCQNEILNTHFMFIEKTQDSIREINHIQKFYSTIFPTSMLKSDMLF